MAEQLDRTGRPDTTERVAVRRALRPLTAITAFTAANALLAAALAPADAVQGNWQRLMYVHVPAAWVAYLAFLGVLVASVAVLRWPSSPVPRQWARAAAELGLGMTALTLVSGSVWGRAVWGVWWAWDARLVSTALMFTVYLGYLGLLLRAGGGGSRSAARRAAGTGIAGFAVVPVVHFSVSWWTTLHQPATVLGPLGSAPPLDARMGVALALAVLTGTAVGALVLLVRIPSLRRAERQTMVSAASTAALTR